MTDQKKGSIGQKLGRNLRTRVEAQRARDTGLHRFRARSKNFLGTSKERAKNFGITSRNYQTKFDKFRNNPKAFSQGFKSDMRQAFVKRNPLSRKKGEIVRR